MKRILIISALGLLSACAPPSPRGTSATASSSTASSAAPVQTTAPAGAYAIDKAHTSLLFRVSHVAMSHFTARFTGLDATLKFDPAAPENCALSATVDARSLQTDVMGVRPPFDQQLQDDKWLDTKKFPTMTYKSTSVVLTGSNTARITGDLALHGVTKPVVLDATFNGGYGANSMDPSGARIGFSAHGTLKRSDFGITNGLPPPGSIMGVGDEVEIIIETEFSKPAEPVPPAPKAH